MNEEAKGKRFRLSFDGKELALFVGGIGVICLLLFLYGLNVGRTKALLEVGERAAHRVAMPPGEGMEPGGGVRVAAPPGNEEQEEAREGKEDEAEGDDLKASDLTFYNTLPDKEREIQKSEVRTPPMMAVEKRAKSQPIIREEPSGSEETQAPATAVEVKRKVKPAEAKEEDRGGFYSVQVSSFRDWSKAMTLKKKLVQSGYGAYVVQSGNSSGEEWFRVRVGNFKVKKEAEQAARKIGKEERLPAFAVLVSSGAAH